MTRGQSAALAVLLVGAVAVVAAVWAKQATAPPAFAPLTSGAGVKIELTDKPLPIPAFAFTDLSGQRITENTGRGKVVLINFWATWCGPCREEIPMLIALQKQYEGRLVILGLSVDDPGPHTADIVQAFAKKAGINYSVGLAPEEVQQTFGGISSVPTTFVVDTSGRLVQRHRGQLEPRVTEHEVRMLAGLPTEAQVSVMKDSGQILSDNAEPVTDVPDLPLSTLTPKQREEALRRLNSEKCTCGCGLIVGRCRVDDPTCTVSPPIARRIFDEVKKQK
jgi:cytochrome c biogenesis protein CcmG/thiol:disulfide interchange protein DsbE